MNGIELAYKYYLEYGLPMLKEKFPKELDKLAIGLVGHGSECFGFDDDTSLDHDYEPGFMIFIQEEDDSKFGFPLMREYAKLPKEYLGYKIKDSSLYGNKAKGVHTIKEFYSFYIGKLPTTNKEWLAIPDFYLAEATNGKIFYDGLGEFSKIREYLLNRPNDVRLKKLASSIFYMAQYGQYNYQRCFKHKEKLAASLCLSKFCEETAKAIYLLNNTYSPYYKWLYKGLTKLDKLADIKDKLEILMEEPYNEVKNIKIIEEICIEIGDEIRKEKLSDRTESYLEGYAYCILNKIKDGELRNSNVML